MEEKLPRKTEKPWGYELLWAHTAKYVGKILFVKKGHRLSMQYHEQKDESMYMYSGKASLETVDKHNTPVSTVFEPGQTVWLPPLTRHRIEAIEDTLLLEVSTPELEDVVRLSDDYGRMKGA
ncbi:MAG TPA: cupin [Dehalococcoidia bacterium]|nr:cupin [Dehalococcoidia bacterium]